MAHSHAEEQKAPEPVKQVDEVAVLLSNQELTRNITGKIEKSADAVRVIIHNPSVKYLLHKKPKFPVKVGW